MLGPQPHARSGGREQRTYAARFECRDDGGLEYKLTGYASTVEQPYDMGPYVETIKRGAFTKTLSEAPDVQLLLNHSGLPLARTVNGSLRLSEDTNGLHFSAQLDRADADSQAVMRRISSGLLNECSFAFRVTRQSWNADYTERSIPERWRGAPTKGAPLHRKNRSVRKPC